MQERVILPVNDTALAEGDPSPAFYCVHSLSGAGGTDFLDLAKLMPGFRFYGIQAPRKKMRDPAFGCSVESIADYYADALITFQPTGPFFLGGWSAGAIIGLQIAQTLRARGRAVRLFAAVDAAPENTDAGRRWWHPLYLLRLAANWPSWIIHENLLKSGVLGSLVRRAANKMIAAAQTRMAGNTSDRTHEVEGLVDLGRFTPDQRLFMKRLYGALLAYKPQNYEGDVVVYEARTTPLLHLPQVGEVWRQLAPRSKIISVKGTHVSILRHGRVHALADDLRARIVTNTAALASSEAGSYAHHGRVRGTMSRLFQTIRRAAAARFSPGPTMLRAANGQ